MLKKNGLYHAYAYDDVAQLNIATIVPLGIRKKEKPSVNTAGS